MENGRTLLSGWIRSAQPAKRELEVDRKQDKGDDDREGSGELESANPQTVSTQASSDEINAIDRFVITLKYGSNRTKLKSSRTGQTSDFQPDLSGTSMFKPKPTTIVDLTPPASQTTPNLPTTTKKSTGNSKQLWDSIFKRAPKQSKIVKLKLPAASLALISNNAATNNRSSRMCGLAPFEVEHVRTYTRITPKYYPKRKKPALTKETGNPAPECTADGLANLKISSKPVETLLFEGCKEALTPAKRTLATCSYVEELITELETSIDPTEYSKPKPFDLGSFESQLWSQKYAAQHMNPQACQRISSWIKSARKNADQDEVAGDNVLVLEGPTGSGKTSAVYTAAELTDSFVFEVSSAVKRTGKALNQLLAGISQNHAVHQASHVVILIDEADIVFEPEANQFWTTLSRYALNTRRPIILTCLHADSVLSSFSLVHPVCYSMRSLDVQTACDLAWSAALGEGHLLDRKRVKLLVAQFDCDLRKALNWLHFWCQMGVNGHPCGWDWAPKFHEMVNTERVLSSSSWFPLPNDNTDADVPTDVFTKSELDISRRPPICTRASPDETVWQQDALALTDFYDCDVEKRNFKYEHDLDIMPYRRVMGAADFRRAQMVESEVRSGRSSSKRLALRALSAEGIDTRQYLNLHYSELLQLIRTSPHKAR